MRFVGIYIPHEEVEKASRVGLYDYFRMTMPSVLKRKGKDYCHVDHDSLCMKTSGEWWWHSRGLYGRNAISYLIIAEDMDFQTAVLNVLEAASIDYRLGKKKTGNDILASDPVYESRNDQGERTLVMPERDSDNSIIIKYLSSRGIDEEITKYFISTGSIYQDRKYKGVCFVGYDKDHIPRLVNIRATKSDFKQNTLGSDRRFAFMIRSDKNRSLHLFEAPIDLLSYACLIKDAGEDFRNYNMISMSGITGSKGVDGAIKLPSCLEQYFMDYPGNTAVYVHFDNDAAGINAGINIKEYLEKRKGIRTYLQYPPEGVKDVNEYLQFKAAGRLVEDTRYSEEERCM